MTCGKHLWSEVGKGRGKTTFSPALFINFGNDCGATDRLCGQHLYLGLSKLLSSSLEWTSNFKVDFLTLTLLPPSQKGPCGYTRLTQTIQHNQLSQNPSANHTGKVPFVIYGYCRRFCKLGYAYIWGPIIQSPINCYLCSWADLIFFKI